MCVMNYENWTIKTHKHTSLIDAKSKSSYYQKMSHELSEAPEEVQLKVKKVLCGK